MKQHITKQQVQELTDKQKTTLDRILHDLDNSLRDKLLWYTSVQCTIGRMIEILNRHYELINIYNDKSENDDYGWWVIECGETPEYSTTHKNVELVNCIWEAVKEVL